MKTNEFLKESNPSSEEYSDEAGMVKDNLHTIIRAMKELGNSLKNNEDIPEWAQEKIAAACRAQTLKNTITNLEHLTC